MGHSSPHQQAYTGLLAGAGAIVQRRSLVEDLHTLQEVSFRHSLTNKQAEEGLTQTQHTECLLPAKHRNSGGAPPEIRQHLATCRLLWSHFRWGRGLGAGS